MKGNKAFHMVAFLLVVVGGLNWFLVGVFQYDLVASIFGGVSSAVARVIYTLVGLAAVYLLFTHKGDCKMCSSGPTM